MSGFSQAKGFPGLNILGGAGAESPRDARATPSSETLRAGKQADKTPWTVRAPRTSELCNLNHLLIALASTKLQ